MISFSYWNIVDEWRTVRFVKQEITINKFKFNSSSRKRNSKSSEVIFTVNKLKDSNVIHHLPLYSLNCKLIWIVLWSVRDPRCFLLLSFCTSSHLYYTFVVYRYYYTFVVINEWNTAKKWRNSIFFLFCYLLMSFFTDYHSVFFSKWITQISYLVSRGLFFFGIIE